MGDRVKPGASYIEKEVPDAVSQFRTTWLAGQQDRRVLAKRVG